jgi:hypothetical protein
MTREHNVGFSGGHGPRPQCALKKPPAMDVRCKPCCVLHVEQGITDTNHNNAYSVI